MRAVDLIRKKRDGKALSKDEISFLVNGYVSGEVPDYQMSAFLMAVYHRDMNDEEAVYLTEAMLASGSRIDLSDIQGVKVGKHSTGGVGDKTSIMLCPVIASMGIRVPKLAGRGLGHTGGTIDKLSSIPGLRTDLDIEEFREVVRRVGCSITGQTAEIAPADRRLYALRDATATAESVPLVASSIMSKKLAEGTEALLLDVKVGSGALMKDMEGARRLARLMVKMGNSAGVKTVALITRMDAPLGRAVGNSLEIKECVAGLKGRMPWDLQELTLTLCAWMLHLADSVSAENPPARLDEQVLKRYGDEVWDYIEHGDAFKKFVEFVDAQHGDPEAVFDLSRLPRAEHVRPVLSPGTGFLKRLDALAVGQASVLLGAGRSRMGAGIDLGAGIVLGKKPGDPVTAGEPIAVFHTNTPEAFGEARDAFLSGIEISGREPARKKPVLEVVL